MRKLTFISLMLALGLTGCAGRELADVTLIRVMGVDGPGPVTLTAVGEGEDAGTPTLYTVSGADVTAAREGLKALGTTRLETTHVSRLVLGPDVDVERTLWEQLTHRASGYGATVWLVEAGSAAELLAGAEDPWGRLKSLEENGGVRAPTLLEALSNLTCRGRTELPVVALSGGGLQAAGTRQIPGKG